MRRCPSPRREKADTQLTIYAATKKATESMGHAYAHLWNLPTTMFRFFTVYGPWGRPDMAYFKFVEAILEGSSRSTSTISGDMYRDFTYVDDLVRAIRLLIDAVPGGRGGSGEPVPEGDSLSPVAPYRIVNIGNSDEGAAARLRGGHRGVPWAEGESATTCRCRWVMFPPPGLMPRSCRR